MKPSSLRLLEAALSKLRACAKPWHGATNSGEPGVLGPELAGPRKKRRAKTGRGSLAREALGVAGEAVHDGVEALQASHLRARQPCAQGMLHHGHARGAAREA